jgi:hypothetical protein
MSNATSAQLEQAAKINSEIVKSLSTAVGTGTWFTPTAGMDQVIYPDARPENSSSEVYYPFYQIADSYIAYNPNGSTTLAYQAAVQEDPVQNNDSGVIVQGTGFQNIVRQAYGSMVFGLSAADQRRLASSRSTLRDMETYVANQLRASFKNTGDYEIVASNNNFFQTPDGNPNPDGLDVITNAYNYILNTLCFQQGLYSNAFNTGGKLYGMWQSYFTNADESINQAALNDNTTINAFVSEGQTYLMTAFLQDTSNSITSEMNPSYGPLVVNGRSRAPEYSNPLTASIYSAFSNASTNLPGGQVIQGMNSKAGQSYNNGNILINTNSNQLTSLNQYLSNYVGLTAPGSVNDKVQVGLYNSVVEGFPNAPKYALPYQSTALSGAQTGNNVSFELNTTGSSSESKASSSTSDVSWDAGASYSGWYFGGSVSNSGSKTSKESWSSFDDSAQNLSIKSDWDAITAKSIAPSTDWFLPDALNTAWSSGITSDSQNFKGGYAFVSPDEANQFVTGSLYYVSGIAYGNPTNTVTGKNSSSSGSSESSFESFQQTTTASAGVSYGLFSVGGTTSYSTSNSDSSSSNTYSSENGEFKLVNNPLAGLESLDYAGAPSGLVGIQLKAVGEAIDPIVPGVSSSSARTKSKYTLSLASSEIKSSKNKPFYLEGKTIFFSNDDDGHDYIIGGAGNQTVYGLSGKETIDLGRGSDSIWTGTGRSKVTGGGGSDIIYFRKDTVAEDDKSFTKLMDWTEKDGLAFNGYFIDDITVKGVNGGKNSKILMDGERVAKFMGLEADLLQTMVEDAHYSIYM